MLKSCYYHYYLPSPRRQWRTEKSGENWLQSHLWGPNNPPQLRDRWRWRLTMDEICSSKFYEKMGTWLIGLDCNMFCSLFFSARAPLEMLYMHCHGHALCSKMSCLHKVMCLRMPCSSWSVLLSFTWILLGAFIVSVHLNVLNSPSVSCLITHWCLVHFCFY